MANPKMKPVDPDPEVAKLLEFFDLGKSLERVKLESKAPSAPEKHKDFWITDWENDDNDDRVEEAENPNYWEALQEESQQELLHKIVQERTGGTIGDHHNKGARPKTKVGSSAMSALETLSTTTSRPHTEDSSLPGPAHIRQAENLNALYNFNVRSNRSKELPITQKREEILSAIENNQVTVVTGATGCGKTTQIPQFILDQAASKNRFVNIVITQPRRIAAQSVARRVCEERDWPLGRLVGYKVGLDKENFSQDTRLLYCTTGVLKKIIINKRSIQEFTHVILDEVHEREEDMDFLLLLCKTLLQTNSRRTKLVLMSATISVQSFQQYFSHPIPGTDLCIPAEVLDLEHKKPHPVHEFFTSDLPDAYDPLSPPTLEDGPRLFDENILLCEKLLKSFDEIERHRDSGTKGTALVFLPGEYEIMTVKRVLSRAEERFSWDILLLYSRMPFDDMRAVFKRPKEGTRKIILATNMAESSITIPDVEYVIDFCLTKYLKADPETNYVSLRLDWADKQSMTQRLGRAGRVKAGRAYKLITKTFYDGYIDDCHPPEMVRAPLDKVILDTKMLDFGPPKNLLALAMDPPELKNIQKTVLGLKEMGAMLTTVNGVEAKDDGDITALGRILSGLPVDARLGKLIVLGHLLDVLEECTIIAAGLSSKSIFAMPADERAQAYASKLIWSDRTFSDCMAVLIAYTKFQSFKTQGYFERSVPNKEKRHLELEWCRQRFLQWKVLQDVELTKKEITRALERSHIESYPTPNRQQMSWNDKQLLIHVALFGAFYPNYFVKAGGGSDLQQIHKLLWGHDPTSCVYLTKFPNEQAPYAELYTGQIKELFADVCDPSKIKVTIPGGRVIVQFPKVSSGNAVATDIVDRRGHDTNFTGDISHNVYVAMKLREDVRSRQALFVKLFKAEEAKRQLMLLKERTVNSSLAQSVSHDAVTFSSIGRVPPPSLKTKDLLIEVVHVNSPGSFWFQYLDDESQLKIKRVEDAIGLALASGHLSKCSRQQVVKNGVYLAPFEGDFYRARVEKRLPDDIFRVFYIDYGNVGTVKKQDLLDISPKAQQLFPDIVCIPALSLEASLVHVRPNPLRDSRGLWDEESIHYVKELIGNRMFQASVYSVTPQQDSPLVMLTLFLESKRSLNSLLTSTEERPVPFAINAQETFSSEVNHAHRMSVGRYGDSWAEELDKVQVNMYQNDGDIAPECHQVDRNVFNRGTHDVKLSGPHHPFEYSLNACHELGARKTIKIDRESVNSVLLDRSPTSKFDTWCVAGNVSMSSTSSFLTLRSTNFLPDLPGIGALLMMIFAPVVEMRCNQKRRRYTGFLAGLGSRESDWGRFARTGVGKEAVKVPYFGEHDMEVNFDVEFDQEDLEMVNQIRYVLNDALTEEEFGRGGRFLKISQASGIVSVQEKLQKQIRQLLTKSRVSKEKESFHLKRHQWNQLPKKEFLEVPKIQNSGKFVFQMISGVQLQPPKIPLPKEKKRQLVLKLQELANIALADFTNLKISCPICPNSGVLDSSADVERHIAGKLHRDNFEMF